MPGARFIYSIYILAVIAKCEERWVVNEWTRPHLSCQLSCTVIDIVDVDSLRFIFRGCESAKEHSCLGSHHNNRG